ncbi:putative protein OS=Tsukamurella paurometabola (strain ATCC 8368 / DSM / CCUG 35730 /CIP 100753 / JCM 10117 / KCTC 9821 / NBRC 16120 / NCIMB 702349/ NCTC 13040) OX=521096 GN=Tpau_0499 PE=4 SV=1 [Tsukamurella paurometabola]|uniref:Uncharacterized protein n=1 Tax=Tsukamurella paurometabola (strain ATCC 8368 / DSM 20162 / CCUG 35730 / CIP 100753 / JCM 10117 / KCTC 9821 / NBRC 16120 / NCIMB 702349 / NCTC 13040) TaxID=521096 RepID=D5US73_TSUPD|nr:hypothetical protein [Tsukamurella paurometabola]ADG77140.1 hypothetical protein Tpau_0499 [Tsukamurella paurometabola DSM 20162]SUP42920.1 Uncharacterised protein [Tsukamurella paurometabola]
MTGPAPSSLAAERTQLARIRTLVALILVAALVGRLAMTARPLVALPVLAVVVVVVTLAFRLGRAPAGAGRALILSGAVVTLATVAAVSAL